MLLMVGGAWHSVSASNPKYIFNGMQMPSADSPQVKENPAAPVLSEGRVLGVAAFLALPIAAFAPRGMAPLLALSSFLLLGLTYRQAGSLMAIFRQFPKPMVAVLGVFLVYATLSVFWSINPAGTMRSVLGIGLAFLGGLVVVSTAVRLTKTDQDFFERALVAGGLFGFGLIGFELLSDTAISRILITLKGGKVFELPTHCISQRNKRQSRKGEKDTYNWNHPPFPAVG